MNNKEREGERKWKRERGREEKENEEKEREVETFFCQCKWPNATPLLWERKRERESER